MLLHRKDFTVGLRNKNKFELYNDSSLKSNNQELVHTDTTYDIEEASKIALNKKVEGFVRNNKDGFTSYYTINNIPYTNDDRTQFTPEELEFPRRHPSYKWKTHSSLSRELFTNDVSENNMHTFLLLFIILLIAGVLFFMVISKRKSTIIDTRVSSTYQLRKNELKQLINRRLNI